ncbi:MAG: energy-coupling factor transporter transmembrane protein EcfT [Chloroflexi bacterium]|nr:energy-coupling factor transporter transmembrane protein EcfT [Chloroflexota bacterium]
MFASFTYLPGHSFIHRLDPRTKLLAFILIMLGTIVVDDVRVLAALLAISLLYYAFANLSLRSTWKAWAVVLFFSVVLIGLFSTTLFGRPPSYVTTSHPWFSFPAVSLPFVGTVQRTITWELVFFGIARVLRPLIIMATILPFTFTTSPYLYGVAFRKLGLSDGVSFALDLSLRYVPTIARDFFITVDAQRARGYELEVKGGGVFNMIRRAAPLIVPVTINAIAGGEDVVEAMELRAFGVGQRTWADAGSLRYTRADYFILGAGLVILITLILLTRFTSYGPYWFPVNWFE